MAAIYSVFTSPHHAPMPNHLPTLIVTPHGQPHNILYSYLHTDHNSVNYLLTPSPEGDLCVAKLFPPARHGPSSGASTSSHSSKSTPSRSNVVRCEASRELRWTIENAGVRSPIYKIVNSDDTPLYQISKPNPNAEFWTMFYFAYAGHQIPPRRVEFGKISKNPPEKGGGTRITVTGRTEDEKKVWQTLGEGNEDCVEWVIACACLNLLDDEILKAAERKAGAPGPASSPALSAANVRPPPTRPMNSGPQATSRSLPNASHSSPILPSAQASRPGNHPYGQQAYDPIRSRSTEPPRTQGVRQGTQPGADDPRYQQPYHPANVATHHQLPPQGNRGNAPSGPARYGPGGQPAPQAYGSPSRGSPAPRQGRI